MSLWLIGVLAAAAASFAATLWWLNHRGDAGPSTPLEHPGDDTQFARWLNSQELADRAEEGRDA